MTDSTAILVAAGIGFLQVVVIGVVGFLWSEIKGNRAECAQVARENKEDLKFARSDLMDEIASLRDKLGEALRQTKEDIREAKDDVMSEVHLLRTKVHSLSPVQESLDNFVKFMRERK